jgi:AcrR family transcriptional regulator
MTVNKPKDERIAEIIDAAVIEFAEKGFEYASMESIARRAKLSKGGVYHHFQSKDEILLLANKKVSEPARLILDEIRDTRSPSEKLRTYITRYLNYWSTHSKELVFNYLSISKSLANPQFFAPFEEYASGTINALETIYRDGVKNNEFRQHDSKARSLALCVALDGVTMYLNTSKRLKLEDIINNFLQVFVKDLLKEN